MRYYQNQVTGKIENETYVNGLMISSGMWKEYKKIPRYSIETPPYAQGRIEFDEFGPLCRYEDVKDLLDEIEAYLLSMAKETDWDSDGAITDLIERMK